MIPTLDHVHHLKLPVTDLDRSTAWYASRLGYAVAVEFHENGHRAGVVMNHPDGGPQLGLRLDPERARAAAGFDYFAIGVPDKLAMEALAAHLTRLGEVHAGVHFATIGWILPNLHDPDGHEVRFYTTDQHTDLPPGPPLVINDAVATAARRQRELNANVTGETMSTIHLPAGVGQHYPMIDGDHVARATIKDSRGTFEVAGEMARLLVITSGEAAGQFFADFSRSVPQDRPAADSREAILSVTARHGVKLADL